MNGLFAASFVLPPNQLFFYVSPWVRHNRIDIVQGFGNADLEFGNFIEVVLFGGEVEAGHDDSPDLFSRAEAIT